MKARTIAVLALITMIIVMGAGLACGDDDDPGVENDPQSNQPQDNDPEENLNQPQPCELRLGDENGEVFASLSDYCFFRGDPAAHQPSEGVFPYEVAAELYADRSKKERFIVLPDGETIGFHAEERWDWPDDTILIKTFYYPYDERDPEAGRLILETRLLHKRDGQWRADSYVWDEDQQDAQLHNFGQRTEVEFIDLEGDTVTIDYRIPNRNQCTTCHGQSGDLVPLGPRTRQLLQPHSEYPERGPQLEDFVDQGLFDSPPENPGDLFGVTDPHDESAPLEDRARAYLDANCAHCHNPDGRASSSNLFLDIREIHPRRLGVCKSPVAAGQGSGGRSYDIVPGEPDESIMIFRMESTNPAFKMPELPITTVDEFGVSLIREWIEAMEATGCD